MPPNNKQRGRPGWRSGGLAKSSLNDIDTQRDSKDLLARQATLATAIPANPHWWRLKAISPEGEAVILPGCFPGRLQALGAAVMLAEKCGGRVVP